MLLKFAIDNLLELIGVAAIITAVALLAGFAWAILALGVALLVLANFSYSGVVLRVPVPRLRLPRRASKADRIARRARRDIQDAVRDADANGWATAFADQSGQSFGEFAVEPDGTITKVSE